MKKYIFTSILGAISFYPTLLAQNWGLKLVNFTSSSNTQSMLYVPQSDRLLVANGAKVYILNPYFTRLEDSIAFPDIVQKMAISDDARYLYAVVGGTKIMRYNLVSRQQERTISMVATRLEKILSPENWLLCLNTRSHSWFIEAEAL